jgi:hypothetical protein
MCLSRTLTAGRCIALADADGGTDVLAVYDGLPPGLATEDNEASPTLEHHRCRNALPAGAVPAPPKFSLDAWRTVAARKLREDRRHKQVELLPFQRTSRGPSRTKCVVPGAGEPEGATHQRLRVVRLLRLDEGAFWRRSIGTAAPPSSAQAEPSLLETVSPKART